MSALPSEAAARVEYPMADGLLFYFPAALAWVSRCSKVGNDQHNPGEKLHWAMDKSTDHANKIIRHLLEVGTDDADGIPHSVKVAWRALALAQEDLMARKGAPMPRNGRMGAVKSFDAMDFVRMACTGRQPPNCDFARDDQASGL